MELCLSCEWYNKKYDEFRETYYDVIDESDKRQKHGCIMYQDHIPQGIWYENKECPYYSKKGKDYGTGS